MNLRINMDEAVCFDIETIADPEAIPLLPPVEPDSRLKDPAKIAEDIARKEAEQLSRLGLSPWTSYICAFGWKANGNEGGLMLERATPDAEEELLDMIFQHLSHYKSFITFNGAAFDIPFIYAHALIRGVKTGVYIDTAKYRIGNHLDVRAVLTNWEGYAKGTSLNFFSKRILGRSPKDSGVDGSQVQSLWDQGEHETIRAYCLDDVRATWDLAQLVNRTYLR